MPAEHSYLRYAETTLNHLGIHTGTECPENNAHIKPWSQTLEALGRIWRYPGLAPDFREEL